ncbi:MAG: TerB family tellurite resistance protein [Methylocystis sp.]
MFDTLKSFIGELFEAPQERVFEDQDYRLAAGALLVHIAAIDGEFDAAERARVQRLVEERFNLSHTQAHELIAHATEREREAVDLYHFTSVLKRSLDDEGRRQLVGMLWEIAYADGDIDECEENVVWRVAELLGVSTRERVTLRQFAREEAENEEPPPPGPWSPS